jgi:hypothetical protein
MNDPRWTEQTAAPIVGVWNPAFYFGLGSRAETLRERTLHLMGSARQVTQIGWLVTAATPDTCATTSR